MHGQLKPLPYRALPSNSQGVNLAKRRASKESLSRNAPATMMMTTMMILIRSQRAVHVYGIYTGWASFHTSSIEETKISRFDKKCSKLVLQRSFFRAKVQVQPSSIPFIANSTPRRAGISLGVCIARRELQWHKEKVNTTRIESCKPCWELRDLTLRTSTSK
ncbi:unnamed protein product [Phyllotreta striolata]|uniref:Uncharacterized protein n=1 Tax=Phyllotreta striolata TaxID=444603 RepID=A0A9N9TKH0_PHYSR|nr:unnamed protein product [Phyllotreta striolata]